MKTTKSILLTLAMLLIVGCTSQAPIGTDNAATSTSQLPSTLTPTIEPSETATPIHTPTLIPTLTWTPLPTLSANDARTKVEEMLQTNGNCDLPCLWGITPGKTSFQEATSNLLPLVSFSEYSYLEQKPLGGKDFIVGDIGFNISDGGMELLSQVDFLSPSDSDIINRVVFEGRALRAIPDGFEDVYHSPIFSKYFEYYMLSTVLKTHGLPTSVMIWTVGGIPPTKKFGHFDLLLLYPDQGILVNYTTDMQIVDENVKGCFSNAHVELELTPSGNADLFYEILEPSYWPEFIKEGYKQLEQVTSLTLDEFYNTFKNSSGECLLTPVKFWPVGEQ